MSQELLPKAQEIIRIARKAGAQDARALVNRSTESTLEWRDGQLDRLSQSTSLGVGLSLFVDGRFSAHSTSDLRPEALESFIAEAVAMTRALAPDPHRRLPDPARYAGRFSGDLQMYDPEGSARMTGVERRRIARNLEEAVRANPEADKILSVSTVWSDAIEQSAMVNSNGMEGTNEATSFAVSAEVVVRDENERKPSGDWYSVVLHRDQLDPLESVARKALEQALSGIGEAPVATGRYPCIIENRQVGRAMGGLLAAFYGGNIQQQQSFLADKAGAQIGSAIFTVINDPHVPGGFGSRTYDSEGMSTVRMPVIERGVVRNFFFDTYYASKLGVQPTTGSQSNLVFETGSRDLEAMLQAMGTGLLVTGFMGGNSNSTTGDFSIGIRGHWIENGKRVKPVSEMNLSGNHLEVWKHLVEVGNDPWPYSSTRSPSFRFDELQFSGA
ncbi:MAG: TldD/PmbA family protein [Candidatus Eisenbacteria bacterium]|nr:TldD/PmbA family protein [Candidatus Eisenbacteria bacterium]